MAQGLVYVGAALCAVTGAAASAQEVALSFTAEQAAQGRAAYDEDCAICHGANLSDGPLGAPLKGDAFMRKYGGKPSRALFDVARTTMPTANPGSLPVETYAALVAFMLDENDIVAGEEPLPTDPQLLAAMQVPAGGFSFMAFSPYTARPAVDSADAARRLQRRHRRLDCRAAGRRLARLAPQLRRAGVQPACAKSTRATSRTCGSRGAGRCRRARPKACRSCATARSSCRPTATSCRRSTRETGDLLWQYTHTLEQGASPFHKRGLALSGNRLYLGTSDVHVVALDVATGEVVWDTTVGDFRRREGLNGGPLVARGKVMVGTTGTGVAAKNRRAADRRARRGNGRDSVAARHDRAARRARRRELERHSVRPAQRRVRLDAGQLRSRDGPRLLRHGQHLRHGAAARAERTGHHERRAVHELDARRESRHRRARLALPAFPERPVGSRLGVRAADHGSARQRHDAPRRADGRQDRHLRRGRRAALASSCSRSTWG